MSSMPVTDETGPGRLVPIDAVARRFGVKSSTLRYYEERGLIEPASRHAGRRWYGQRELRRLAVIRFWQRNGLMSLDVIRELLDGSAQLRWQEIVQRHIDDIQAQVEQLQRVQAHISQSLDCQYHDDINDCPDYERMIWQDIDNQQPVADGPRSVVQ
jgi:MerR family transcriptional regulator, copper efflux regulator